MKWKEVSWVLRGRLRNRILVSLDKPKTATTLSKEIKTHRSTISGILKDLEKKGLTICLDPKEPYNRFYKRTEKGEKIVEKIKTLIGH